MLTSAAIAIALTWLLSGWFHLCWMKSDGWINISLGSFVVMRGQNTAGFQRGLRISRVPVKAPAWYWGFQWEPRDVLQIPLWAPFLAAAAPAAALWRPELRDRRRRRSGRCPSCGYDRRGLTPDAKCPECGAVAIK
jgi:hypothetical protein